MKGKVMPMQMHQGRSAAARTTADNSKYWNEFASPLPSKSCSPIANNLGTMNAPKPISNSAPA